MCAVCNGTGHLYKDGGIDLSCQPNYICMNGLDDDDLEALGVQATDVSHKISQLGSIWAKLRKHAPVTGMSPSVH